MALSRRPQTSSSSIMPHSPSFATPLSISLHPPPSSHPRPTRTTPRCLHGSPNHLPSDAYLTLADEDTPSVCRLITALHPATASHQSAHIPTPLSVTRAIDSLVQSGLRCFDVGSTHHTVSSHPDPAVHARDYVRLVGPSAARKLRFCTQVEVNPHQLDTINSATAHQLVDRQLTRLGLDRIDLFQLAWSDFRDNRYVDLLGELLELKRNGKLAGVGTLDFPTLQLRHLTSQSLHVASNQVSFSLLDRRAIVEMADWCQSNQTALLAYSSVGTGFISEQFLGLPEPTNKVLSTPRLSRFATMIRLWGGWSLFQELLYAAKQVADKHHVTMPNVAVKWALQQPALPAVVVDTRPGIPPDIDDCISNLRAFHFSLDEDDIHLLDSVATKGNDLHHILGDCGSELQPRVL